jgi:hypothetical protein
MRRSSEGGCRGRRPLGSRPARPPGALRRPLHPVERGAEGTVNFFDLGTTHVAWEVFWNQAASDDYDQLLGTVME